MRICLTVPSLDRRFGGPIASAFGLAKGLRANQQEVVMVGCGHGAAEISIPAIGRFHSTPIPRRLSPIRRAVKGSDVLHVLGYRDPIGTAAILGAKKKHIPYVFEPLGMFMPVERSLLLKSLYQRLIGTRLLNEVGAIITSSQLEAQQFEEFERLRDLVHVRPNGIDVESLDSSLAPGSIRRQLGIPIDAPLVISLARITKKKRLDHLVKAVEGIQDLWVLIAGPDSQDGGLGAVMSQREISIARDRIVVHPQGFWGEEKIRAMLDADCFCLPSAWETSPIAMLEAVALGLPVVVSDRCGGTEFLGGAVTVTPFGDIDSLAAAIRAAIDSSDDVAREVEAARIRKEHNWTAIARRQLQIYSEALS